MNQTVRATFSFVLPPDLANRLFVLSRYLGNSRGSIIRQGLENHLALLEQECNYQDFLFPFMAAELLKDDSQFIEAERHNPFINAVE